MGALLKNINIRTAVARTFFCAMTILGCVTNIFAQDVSLSVNLYPDNTSSSNPVTVTLNGKVYTEDIWFDEIENKHIMLDADEAFIVTVVSAYQHGTANDILNLWHPDDKDEIRPYVNNTEMFAKTKSYSARIKQTVFLAKINYGAYKIFLVQQYLDGIGNKIKEYPIITLNGKYYLTNKLQADPVFLYIASKYKASLSLKTR